MAKHYFRYIPDFNYVSRLPGQKNISDYTRVKNLFKRAKIRDDIFQDLTYFTQYKIVGDDRPDLVAKKVYGDSRYDWLVLLANNMMNITSEWPMTQDSFYNYMIRKYGDESKFTEIHHYETVDIRDSIGRLMVRAGFEVPEDYTTTYFDNQTQTQVTTKDNKVSVTNYEYEEAREDSKRNIHVIKPKYLGLIKNNLDDIMPYKKGSTQFISDDVVQGDNIRLYT